MSAIVEVSRRGAILAARREARESIVHVGEPSQATTTTAIVVFVGMIAIVVGLPIYWLATRGA